MRFFIKIKWSEGDDKWHMLTDEGEGKFIYDFFDCDNFNKFFDHPDKKKEELYVVEIKRMGR